MAKSNLTSFVSQVVIQAVESASNTLTFKRLETGIQPLEKVGWVLQKALWRLAIGDMALMNGTGDAISLGLTMSDKLTAVTDTDPAVLARKTIIRTDMGTAATGTYTFLEFDSDWSSLQGGGLLVLPNPLYMSIEGVGLSGAATATVRLFFFPIEMGAEDYFNLVQSRQILVNS